MTERIFVQGVAIVCMALSCFWPIERLAAATPPAAGKAASAATSEFQPIYRDIELGNGGTLRGQLLDAQGQPRPGQAVVLLKEAQLVGQTTTDAEGHFTFDNLQGGTYQLYSNESCELCRCWMPHTAPPSAEQQVLLVEGQVQRGQRPFHHMLANPLVIGLLIAAAIAIPIAIHNANEDEPTGS